jgi:hypothetical protein
MYINIYIYIYNIYIPEKCAMEAGDGLYEGKWGESCIMFLKCARVAEGIEYNAILDHTVSKCAYNQFLLFCSLTSFSCQGFLLNF